MRQCTEIKQRGSQEKMEIDEGYKVYMQDIVKSLPATIFFKDTEGKYVFTTKTCDLINAGRVATIIE